MGRPRTRPHFGLKNKKKLFVEGFVLLRRLAEGPLTREEAESELGIPYREWYRWLEVFRDANIPLAYDYKARRDKRHNAPTVRLWPEDWQRLIQRSGSRAKSRARLTEERERERRTQAIKTISKLLGEL
jgi:hypothetical protein